MSSANSITGLDLRNSDRRIAAIVDYLTRIQQSDGAFPNLRFFRVKVAASAVPTEFDGWYTYGKAPLVTATVLYHLADIELPGIAAIRFKSCEFLIRAPENGVVRNVPAYERPIDIPTDVDSTCLTAASLERNGVSVGCNRAMVLNNVNAGGDVFTWLIPRWRQLRHPANFLWLAHDRRAWIRRRRSYGLSESGLRALEQEYRATREPGVAANVLLLLGVGPRTRKILARLLDQIEKDGTVTGYYPAIATYFHVARLYRLGIVAFDRVRRRILDSLAALQRENGEIESPFFTALAALSFIYYGEWAAAPLVKAVRYITDHPMHDDGWKPHAYYNDLHGMFFEGSAGLTATLYLEVMYLWRRRPAGIEAL